MLKKNCYGTNTDSTDRIARGHKYFLKLKSNRNVHWQSQASLTKYKVLCVIIFSTIQYSRYKNIKIIKKIVTSSRDG